MKKISMLLALILCACGSNQDPQLFLPKLSSPEGVDLEALRSKYCQGVILDLDNLLTPENFRSVFNCANYDSKLDELRPLFTSQEFPDFLKNINVILGSKNTQGLQETLRDWFEETSNGESRLDRLIPLLAKVIRNPSFQDSLPLVSDILQNGREVWPMLLPGLSDLVYQDRFPDTLEDIGELFSEPDAPTRSDDFARQAKQWAIFVQKKIDGKTIALRSLELANQLKEIRLHSTNLQEYLDHMNEKGVFVSLYLDNGAVRGEQIDPKLNADPETDEEIELTPEERRQLAYKKLFQRKLNQDAPIVELAAMLEEFQNPHDDFLPALSRWFSANGPRVIREITEYVLRAQVVLGISDYSIESYLNLYLEQAGRKPQEKVDGEQFAIFVREAFQSPLYFGWNENRIFQINREYFGAVNADLLRASRLAFSIHELYLRIELEDFAKNLIPSKKTLALNSAIKRFSNLHQGIEIKVEEKNITFENYFAGAWLRSAEESLGKSVVVDFVVKLAQTLFSQMATDFQGKGITLSEWYFSSAYSNPSSTEALAGYAFKELDFLEKWKKHKDYLTGDFAAEVFPEESDRRAFRLLVNQVPNIWIYLKSGMSRSGNDITRALSSKDRGYLIKNYVRILVEASRIGLIRDGVRLIEEYHKDFQPDLHPKEISDLLEERRKVSRGADALKRIMRSLFEPEQVGFYETSTLGRILLPLSDLVSPQKRNRTERFLLSSAREIEKAEDQVLKDFFKNFLSNNRSPEDLLKRRESRKATADLLRDPKFPIVVRQLSQFFQEDAVEPALNYLAEKIEDGSLQETLLFLRRVLGFRA
jgi:hypothetical protein